MEGFLVGAGFANVVCEKTRADHSMVTARKPDR
jgi:hypothetical protein